MRVGSLFSGIGGLDLGLERAGMRVVWQAETDAFCARVLARHWPGVPNLGDVTAVDWDAVEPVDLVCGGFPCQPVSVAGRRRAQADERWLWPEVARCLRHLRPRLALLENVPGLLAGPGMGDVLGDLAGLGYDTEWESIPAAAVGAPHLRYRVFVVAYSDSGRRVLRQREEGGAEWDTACGEPASRRAHVAYANGQRLAVGVLFGGDARSELQALERGGGVGDADLSPPDTLAAGCRPRGPAGEPGWWATEPDVGRVAHGVPARVDRLRALGNAVVPQVAEWIGGRIMSAEGHHQFDGGSDG